MKAAIITIGDELLIGQVVDTNSAWLAEKLTELGFTITTIVTIPDEATAIKAAISSLLDKNNFIITTGGLGPTSDDITKQTLADLYGGKLVFHEESLRNIEHLFSKRGLPVSETNKKQALVPSSCLPLVNRYGTAPGMLFETKDHILVTLPGVPFEMKGIFNDELLPFLNKRLQHQKLSRVTINTFGIPESFLSDKLADFEKELKANDVKIAYLPSPSGIRIRLTSKSKDKLTFFAEELQKRLGEHVFGLNDDTLPKIVSERLRKEKKVLAVAESCTGGYLSHLITKIPGSSDIFNGGIVAYSNEIKHRVLGVPVSIMETHGAVSKETVNAMLDGVFKVYNSDIAVAISGIAGPTGATPGKPVGTTWIGVASKTKRVVKLYTFGNLREINIQRASYTALFEVLKLL
jgi:nicotinamide-nucleotide amidase